MLWNRPRKTIGKILLIISILSLVILSIAIITMVIWIKAPQTVINFDKSIPDFYGNTIEDIYKFTKGTTNKEKKLMAFKKLYEKTKNLTSLERFYEYKKTSNQYLIDYYLKNDNSPAAFKIVEYWKNNNPSDFDAKFAYINVLNKYDKTKAEEYYASLYDKYFNIENFIKGYVVYLVNNNQISKALSVQNKFNSAYNKSRSTFMLFYIDGESKVTYFSHKQIIRLNHYKEKISKKIRYTIKIDKNFEKLKGLRLDIDSASIGSEVSNIKISIKKDGIEYENLGIAPMHSVANFKQHSFTISGKDPHVKIELPEGIKNKSGNVKILISMDIVDETNYVKKEILKNKEWGIYYDTGNGFNEIELKHIRFTNKNLSHIYKSDVSWENVSSIRLDLPSLIGVEINNFSIVVNDKIKLDSSKVISLHGLELEDDKFTVNKKDPYLIINLNETIDIHSIAVSMRPLGINSEL